jgi:hypothetical protein
VLADFQFVADEVYSTSLARMESEKVMMNVMAREDV